MPIEKRYYDLDDQKGYLKCFHSAENTARFVIENGQEIQIVDIDADELKEFICDLQFILKQINDEDELH